MLGPSFLVLILLFILFYVWKFQLEISLSASSPDWLRATVRIGFFGWRTLKVVTQDDIELMLLEPLRLSGWKRPCSDFPLLFIWLKKIKVSYRWKTTIGLDEPMLSAMLSGILWSVKGLGAVLIGHFMSLKKVEVAVSPVMNEWMLQSELNCIIELQLVHIIPIAGILIMRKIRRRKDGSKQHSVQPSH